LHERPESRQEEGLLSSRTNENVRKQAILKDETQPQILINNNPESQSEGHITEPSWTMFEKIKELGVGSFGKVYLVKCNQNSLIRTDASNLFNNGST
jgi:hypothetical protein